VVRLQELQLNAGVDTARRVIQSLDEDDAGKLDLDDGEPSDGGDTALRGFDEPVRLYEAGWRTSRNNWSNERGGG
jgi:class 3 adenylate cyclase